MSDEDVTALLDSNVPLVVIEAPAGCGKTYQGSHYAQRAVSHLDRGRILILTHTHAACGVFSSATASTHRKVEIRTIDSLIVQIAAAYHRSLDLSPDPYAWARQHGGSFPELATRVAELLMHRPMISEALACRYPIVIGDEHQDSSAEQDAILMSLHHSGARLRVFGDPMQRIYNRAHVEADAQRWEEMKSLGAYSELEIPHRWREGSPELGRWVLDARTALMSGNPINLTGPLPESLQVIYVDNQSPTHSGFQLTSEHRRPIDQIVDAVDNLLVLTGRNDTVDALAAFWRRRIPIWEGHTRDNLEILVDSCINNEGNAIAIAEAVVCFLREVSVGFTRSRHGDRFVEEVATNCTKRARGMPALIQELGRHILTNPNHVGISRCLSHLFELINQQAPGFDEIKIDYRKEYYDAMRLMDFPDPGSGLLEINRRRSFSHQMPPAKSISTIHKAKGLQCDHAIILPCDSQTFPATDYARCKLYVAISRAKSTLTLVLSTNKPSPLFYTG